MTPGAGRLFAKARRLALACALMGAGAAAQAQGGSAELATSPAVRCLTPAVDARVKPVYPAWLLERKVGDSVRADFTFTGPDSAPSVEVHETMSSDFERAIEVYAKQLRVPCMAPGDAPVHLSQTFDFVPNDGRKVAWTTPIDAADDGRREQSKCVVRPPTSVIRYPDQMMREGRAATVVAHVRFDAADQAPFYEVLDDGGHKLFGRAVEPYLSQLRMPCLSGGPVAQTWVFPFSLDGGGRTFQRKVLKDLTLQTFLSSVKPFPTDSVYFDTTTMKCPFDVRLNFRQPIDVNKIEELEEDVPARHAFLDWLGARELDLDRKTAGQLYGQSMVVHVPCLKIDL